MCQRTIGVPLFEETRQTDLFVKEKTRQVSISNKIDATDLWPFYGKLPSLSMRCGLGWDLFRKTTTTQLAANSIKPCW